MIDSRLEKKPGFSLLELGVIMFIMMIILGFSLPRFPRLFESDLQLETRKLARLIDELRQQAIFSGETQKLVFDTKKSEYTVFTAKVDQPEHFTPHKQFDKPVPLKAPVQFYAVSQTETPDEDRQFAGRRIVFDKIFGEQFQVYIDSSGFVDLFTVRLKDQKNQLSLSVVNIMGKMVIGEEIPL
jgi:type II secretory pathway pseudopilin PulG